MEKTIKSNSPAFEGSSQVCQAPPGPFLHGVNSSFDLPGMVRVELIEKPFGSLFQMMEGRWQTPVDVGLHLAMKPEVTGSEVGAVGGPRLSPDSPVRQDSGPKNSIQKCHGQV